MASPALTNPPPTPSSPTDNLSTNAGSETSVGFAEPCPGNIVVSANLPVIPPSEKAVPLTDACCLALYCQAHEKLLLSPLKGGVGVDSLKGGLYLPTVSFRNDSESWNAVAGRLLQCTLQRLEQQKKSGVVAAGSGTGDQVRTTTRITMLQNIDWYRVQQPKKAPLYTNRVTFISCIPSKQKCYCFSSKTVAAAAVNSATSSTVPVPAPPPTPLSSGIISSNSKTNSSNKQDFVWLSVEELKQTSAQDRLWGPEVMEIVHDASAFYGKAPISAEQVDSEWTGLKWIYEVSVEDALELVANRSGEFSKERALLFSARYGESEVLKLFNEYVVHCFPSQFMTFASFRAFMAKLGWHEDDQLLKAIFSTLVCAASESVALLAKEKDNTGLLYLTFYELLLGLAAMEERAEHRGDCLLIRLKYIFHFYDEDRDCRLNRKEVEKFVGDIESRQGRGSGSPASSVAPASKVDEPSRSNEGIRQIMSAIRGNGGAGGAPGSSINGPNNSDAAGNNSPTSRLVEEVFRQLTNTSVPVTEESAISEQQFTEPAPSAMGWLTDQTETLFRCNQSTVESATGRFAYSRLIGPNITGGSGIGKMGVAARQVALINRYDDPCERCRRTARFDLCTHGIRVDEFGAIWGTIKFNLCPDYRDVTFLQEVLIDESTFDWIMQFNRYVSLINSTAGDSCNPRPDRYGIKPLLEQVLAIVRREPAVMQLPAPCYIIGEVRSNLEMLYRLHTTIARWYPFVNPANIVLLGNAVDGAEPLAADTVAYLLCLKALAPHLITLLQGPLELAAVADKNSRLHRDWVYMYGEATWAGLVAIIELLPVAAVVEGRLFLTKSGLPQPVMSIEELEVKLNKTATSGSTLEQSNRKQPPFVHLLFNALQNGIYVSQSGVQRSLSSSSGSSGNANKKNSKKFKASQTIRGSRQKTSVAPTTKKRTTPGGGVSNGKISKAKQFKGRKSLTRRSPRGKRSADNGRSPVQQSSASSETPSLSNSIKNLPVFTTANLKRFLHLNGFSHVIRTEMLPPIGAGEPYRVAVGERLITIGGIGKQQQLTKGGGAKLWGSIVLADRQKLRLITLKDLFAGRKDA